MGGFDTEALKGLITIAQVAAACLAVAAAMLGLGSYAGGLEVSRRADVETAKLAAVAARAAEGAALANERAAAAAERAGALEVAAAELRQENLKLTQHIENERDARVTLEKNVASRTITPDQIAHLKSILGPHAGLRAEVVTYATDGETLQYADKLLQALKAAGVDACGSASWTGPPSSKSVRVGGPNADVFIAALIAIGIPAVPGPSLPVPGLPSNPLASIVIGPMPPRV